MIDALDLERPVVWGHSDGAIVALMLSLAAPDRIACAIVEAAHLYKRKPGSRAFFEGGLARPGVVERHSRAWLRIGREAASPAEDFYGGRLGELLVPRSGPSSDRAAAGRRRGSTSRRGSRRRPRAACASAARIPPVSPGSDSRWRARLWESISARQSKVDVARMTDPALHRRAATRASGEQALFVEALKQTMTMYSFDGAMEGEGARAVHALQSQSLDTANNRPIDLSTTYANELVHGR